MPKKIDEPTITGGKAKGCNYQGENAIRRMHVDGEKPKAISDALMIEEACVKSVIADYKANKERYDAAMGAPIPRPIVRDNPADEVFDD